MLSKRSRIRRNSYKAKTAAKVSDTLIELLPLMSTQDAEQLTTRQRRTLSSYVGRNTRTSLPEEADLAFAIVCAYPTIGDGTELPIVRRLAQGTGNAGADEEIREVAQEYLDLVEARKQQEKLSTTLLRASSPVEIGSDTLLRAVHETSTSSPNELLRPTTAESDSK